MISILWLTAIRHTNGVSSAVKLVYITTYWLIWLYQWLYSNTLVCVRQIWHPYKQMFTPLTLILFCACIFMFCLFFLMAESRITYSLSSLSTSFLKNQSRLFICSIWARKQNITFDFSKEINTFFGTVSCRGWCGCLVILGFQTALDYS